MADYMNNIEDCGILSECMEAEVDLDNPRARLVSELLIDNSESVLRYRDEIVDLFPQFIRTLNSMPESREIELGVWTFNRTPHEAFPTQEIYKYLDENTGEPAALTLEPRGRTHTGEAILAALNAMDKRIQNIEDQSGFPLYIPILIIITDGNPLFSDDELAKKKARIAWEAAQKELAGRVAEKRLIVKAIGIGDYVNSETMNLLSGGKGDYLTMREVRFDALYDFISMELQSASTGKAF